jgi:putative chitinase
MITYSKFTRMVPNNKNPILWYSEFIEKYQYYGINNINRIAAFIAQCAHESLDFTVIKENLNYSAEGLIKTWPKRFLNMSIAKKYARQPEKIANYVYANRMGNGPEESGDGWKYSGKGIIQLTGKSNYIEFADKFGIPLEEVGEYLLTQEGAMASAFFFWDKNNLNSYADRKDIIGMTKIINGGSNGLDDRIKKFLKNLKIMNEL